MAANLDFCRKCEAPYTSTEGDFGMCDPCNEQSEGIAESLREAEELRDELDELDAMESDAFYEQMAEDQDTDADLADYAEQNHSVWPIPPSWPIFR